MGTAELIIRSLFLVIFIPLVIILIVNNVHLMRRIKALNELLDRYALIAGKLVEQEEQQQIKKKK